MKKQDRQGVRTVSELERKYAIGQSLKKAQEGIQKAMEAANRAEEKVSLLERRMEKLREELGLGDEETDGQE